MSESWIRQTTKLEPLHIIRDSFEMNQNQWNRLQRAQNRMTEMRKFWMSKRFVNYVMCCKNAINIYVFIFRNSFFIDGPKFVARFNKRVKHFNDIFRLCKIRKIRIWLFECIFMKIIRNSIMQKKSSKRLRRLQKIHDTNFFWLFRRNDSRLVWIEKRENRRNFFKFTKHIRMNCLILNFDSSMIHEFREIWFSKLIISSATLFFFLIWASADATSFWRTKTAISTIIVIDSSCEIWALNSIFKSHTIMKAMKCVTNSTESSTNSNFLIAHKISSYSWINISNSELLLHITILFHLHTSSTSSDFVKKRQILKISSARFASTAMSISRVKTKQIFQFTRIWFSFFEIDRHWNFRTNESQMKCQFRKKICLQTIFDK